MKSDLEKRRLGARTEIRKLCSKPGKKWRWSNPDEYLRDWGEMRVLG